MCGKGRAVDPAKIYFLSAIGGPADGSGCPSKASILYSLSHRFLIVNRSESLLTSKGGGKETTELILTQHIVDTQ